MLFYQTRIAHEEWKKRKRRRGFFITDGARERKEVPS